MLLAEKPKPKHSLPTQSEGRVQSKSSSGMTTVGLCHSGEHRTGDAPFDPEPHYGDGDYQRLVQPICDLARGLLHESSETAWQPRNRRAILGSAAPRIFLDDSFRGRGVQRLYQYVIPGPDKFERQRLHQSVRLHDTNDATESKACFQSALKFARDQAKVDYILALELA